MKRIIYFFLIGVLISCQPSMIKGFVVAKEYVPRHMDDDQDVRIVEASVVPHVVTRPIVVPHRHTPVLVPAKFTLFVANRYNVYNVEVDSLTYIQTKVGQRIVLER